MNHCHQIWMTQCQRLYHLSTFFVYAFRYWTLIVVVLDVIL